MKLHELAKQVAVLIEDNVPDPLNRGKKWVYDDIPRLDLSSYPRIGVKETSSSLSPLGIGAKALGQDAFLQVTIVVRKKQKIDVDSDGVPEYDWQVLDYLADQVIGIVKDNANSLSVSWVLPAAENVVETDGHLIKQIILRARMVR